SSPCALPTRPTLTSSSATENGERLGSRRGDEDVLRGDLLRPRMPRGPDELGSPLEVVVGSPQLHPLVEARPVRARSALVGPADAAGVDEQLVPRAPLELHVR